MQDLKNTPQIIFIAEDQMSAEFRIDEIHQREYLVDGEMRLWDGDVAAVYSPVQLPDGNGGLKRKLIGTYPGLRSKGSQ